LPERPSSACSSSTLRGDLRTSAPGAYLPAVSASGTCAYRRAARAARRPDLMDKPSLQTALTYKLVRARAATPAPLSGQAMPTIHVFHRAGRMHLSWERPKRRSPPREPAKSYIRHNHMMAASTKKTTRRSVIHSNFVALSGASPTAEVVGCA
jgi:hypothetical protein